MRSVVEIGASVPAFLAKLWKLVNDSETNHLISWSPGGKTFIIKNQADFARELLPLYYKHNNMASFIRQLNMYGFHKITSVENGGLRYEKDEIEFSHPCFLRNHSYLLEHIKRKIANPKAIIASENGDKLVFKPELMNKVLNDVKQMKGKQENMDAKFSVMKQENEALWREVALLRQKHIKQQQIVNNLIQFLMSLVNSGRSNTINPNGVGGKRGFQLMINNAAHNSKIPTKISRMDLNENAAEEVHEDLHEDGPTIHELAHDDVLHSDPSRAMSPSEYLTIEVPALSSGGFPVSPSPNTMNSQVPRYHVTMADGDDQEEGRSPAEKSLPSPSPSTHSSSSIPSPISPMQKSTTSSIPGSSKLMEEERRKQTLTTSLNNYNVIPEANTKLPANIFEEASSDSSLNTAAVSETSLPFAKDEMLSIDSDIFKMLTQGTYSKTASGKKVKSNKTKRPGDLQQIKVEQEDPYWDDMPLATLENHYDPNTVETAHRREFYGQDQASQNSGKLSMGPLRNKDDLDDHLDTMQSDLDSLRELLKSDSYTFDTNTLLGLFGQDDPLYGISYNPYEEKQNKDANTGRKRKLNANVTESTSKETANATSDDDYSTADPTNQLMSYTGPVPDLFELASVEELNDDILNDTTLNTPQVTLNTPQVTLSTPQHPGKSPFTSKTK